MIKICLITIHKGEKAKLLKTVDSIRKFLYLEILVGYVIYESLASSLDNGKIAHEKIKYFSCRDGLGITEALNSSQKIARKEFINSTHYVYIHSGDVFCPEENAIRTLEDLNVSNEFYDLIFWSFIFKSSNEISIFMPRFRKINKGMTVPHIGTLISHSLHEKLNGYNNKYKLAMDYDFFMKAYNNCKFIEFNQTLVEIDGDGVSSMNPHKTNLEVLRIQVNSVDKSLKNKFYSVIYFLVSTIKRLIYDLLIFSPRIRKKLRLIINSRIIK